MQAVGTYSGDTVVITWGEILVGGIAPGTFLKIPKPEVKQVASVQGGDGHVARAVRKHNPLRQCEVTLLQTSATNELLGAQAELDRLTGKVIKPLTVKDLFGTTLYEWPQAWITERPDAEMATTITNRVWVFEGPCIEHEGLNA